MIARICCFGSALLLWGAVAAAQESAEQIVRRVQERYDSTADFTANVKQELVLASAGKTISASGTVSYKRAGRMRWTLENHEKQVIIADGTTLWFYQPEDRQVLKAPFQMAFRSTVPISFLIGVGKIAEDFDVAIASADDARIRLEMTPRQGGTEVGRMQLTVEKATYDVVGAEVKDPMGNVTRLEFSDLRRNVGVADSVFAFDVPAGVDVVEAPFAY